MNQMPKRVAPPRGRRPKPKPLTELTVDELEGQLVECIGWDPDRVNLITTELKARGVKVNR